TTTAALAKLAIRDGDDPWVQTAILSSAGPRVLPLLEAVVKHRDSFTKTAERGLQFLTRLASLVGARKEPGDIRQAFALATSDGRHNSACRTAVVEGLGQAINAQSVRIDDYANQHLSSEERRRLKVLFDDASKQAKQDQVPLESRLRAIRLLTYAPKNLVDELKSLLQPQYPQSLQLGAIRALARQPEASVA